MKYLALIAILGITQSRALPTAKSLISNTSTDKPILDQTKTIQNKTLEDLVQQQADAVKKIVADQQSLQYPMVPKFESDYKEQAKKEVEKLSLEELKIKCQHLSKLFGLNSTKAERIEDPKLSNHKLYETKHPVYIQPKPTQKYPTPPKSGFYITNPISTTKKPVTQTPLTSNVKFIRLEPVILQKTILSDGRTVYYWHRSLPSAGQFSVGQNMPSIKPTEPSSTESSVNTEPTETTESYNGYGFGSLFSFYRSPLSTTTTTEKPTTTTTTTTTTTSTEKPIQPLQPIFENQLRFVVPVPYESNSEAIRQPWDFDQFAYYPKELQPSTVNVQVPYSPTFHVIKALSMPNKYGNGEIPTNVPA